MAESHVLSALISKHAELQGEIIAHQNAIKDIKNTLEIISQSIKIFDPDYDLRKIKSKTIQIRYFKNQELIRMTIEFIKSYNGVETEDIVSYIINNKALPKNRWDSLRSNVNHILRNLSNKGIIEYGVTGYKIKH